MKLFKYTDPNGKQRDWEGVERVTKVNAAQGIDQIEIFAVVKSKHGDRLVLTSQFRPPLGKLSLELPAGLVDPGETLEQAALRELKEET